MIDLSNNNGPVDFHRVFSAGQRRVYLKRSESVTFVDHTYPDLRMRAQQAGLLTGAYHFCHPLQNRVSDEAEFFLSLIGTPKKGKDLRPCLDVEWGTPDVRVGNWVLQLAKLLRMQLHYWPVIYSYPSYLDGMHTPHGLAECPLWLASFGRNDGVEYPWVVPEPWRFVSAHQYSSAARVAGVAGLVDISHVFHFDQLAIP